MKKINDFIDRLADATVSNETHAILNDLIHVTETVKQVIGTQSPNIQLRQKISFTFTVSADTMREIYRATKVHIFEPSQVSPNYWMNLEDEEMCIKFETEKVEVFYKENNEFHTLKKS